MPRPERRTNQHELNRVLSSPIFAVAPRAWRRTYVYAARAWLTDRGKPAWAAFARPED